MKKEIVKAKRIKNAGKEDTIISIAPTVKKLLRVKGAAAGFISLKPYLEDIIERAAK